MGHESPPPITPHCPVSILLMLALVVYMKYFWISRCTKLASLDPFKTDVAPRLYWDMWHVTRTDLVESLRVNAI